MSDMFRHYPQPDDYIPDNRPRRCDPDIITIMPGETTTHSFEIPFNVDEEVKDFEVIYKLGLSVILTKGKDSCEVVYDEECHKSILTWILSPEETLLFADTVLKAQVQIKFTMSDNSIAYTEIYTVGLIDALDAKKE